MNTDLRFHVTAHEVPGCTILTVQSGDETISFIPFKYETDEKPSGSESEFVAHCASSIKEGLRDSGLIDSYSRQTHREFSEKRSTVGYICVAIMTFDVFGLAQFIPWYWGVGILFCTPVFWWLRCRKLNAKEEKALEDASVFDRIESQLRTYQRSGDFKSALTYALSLPVATKVWV
jgi:hypothetical protein